MRRVTKTVEQYTHSGSKRTNNPQAGLVTSETDPDQPRNRYTHDPRLDPQLVWTGKHENTEFYVDTVSLHVHEKIDPHSILEKVMKTEIQQTMHDFFNLPENNLPLRNAIEFYRHDQNWSNRLIAGDSVLVMNSLLKKEGMEGKIQMIYIDPPYGIKYGSNFQPFINKKSVTDGKDKDLTYEPEMIKAFRDTWQLEIHSYLSYIKDRLILAKQLLNESGSCFVQISEENVHYVRMVLDEVFGRENFVSQIIFRKKKMPLESKHLEYVCDYILYYAKNKQKIKYNKLFRPKNVEGDSKWCFVELKNGTRRRLTVKEHNNHKLLPKDSHVYYRKVLRGVGYNENAVYPIKINGKKIFPQAGKSWSTSEENVKKLLEKRRLELSEDGETVNYIVKFNDYPVSPLTSLWAETSTPQTKIYVVQTSEEPIKRCILMATDTGDIVLDLTCGSGTTAYVSEKLGRKWITCDTSRIAIALTRQRIMTSVFDYFKLQNSEKGISSGFDYNIVPYITMGSIVSNKKYPFEVLYDKPKIDKDKIRIAGPFTVEAVPASTVKSIDTLSKQNVPNKAYNSYQQQWREELFKTGIRGKNKQKIEFSRVESHPATQYLHADAEIKDKNPKRAVISFGPEHAPLEQRQVENAIKEAQTLIPRPQIVIFAAMQFDPEAAKDIDELKWPGVTILKVEMNKDLLTKDLKGKCSINESFWLIGQPDVKLQKIRNEKYTVTVNGFDYYDTRDGEIKSGNASNISIWMLDEDYDGRSVYPKQIFFPMEGKNGGWEKLATTLNSHINYELIKKYQGIESLPFETGPNKQAAVKIIDDRGIESLKIIPLE